MYFCVKNHQFKFIIINYANQWPIEQKAQTTKNCFFEWGIKLWDQLNILTNFNQTLLIFVECVICQISH